MQLFWTRGAAITRQLLTTNTTGPNVSHCDLRWRMSRAPATVPFYTARCRWWQRASNACGPAHATFCRGSSFSIKFAANQVFRASLPDWKWKKNVSYILIGSRHNQSGRFWRVAHNQTSGSNSSYPPPFDGHLVASTLLFEVFLRGKSLPSASLVIVFPYRSLVSIF